MAYASYALVKFKTGHADSILVACHPEMLKAGLKAFRNESELVKDLRFLTKCFPPPRGSSWLAVDEDGTWHSLDKRSISSTMAKKIYKLCDDKTQHLHKYTPFKEKAASYSGLHRSFPQYSDWFSIESHTELTDLGIKITMEAVRTMKPRKL